MEAKIHELKQFRERRYIFRDRSEAGEILASMLQTVYDRVENGLILAIPSGGVPLGIKMSRLLGVPFDLLIVRKLQIPGNTEAGFGAMTLDGTTFFNEPLLAKLHLSDSQIESEKARVAAELEKRNTLFRKGRDFPDLTGKTVILVDDGLASGFTMLASLDTVKKAGTRERVVAVPTAPESSIERILPKVDQIYCANIRTSRYFAVAEAYQNWYDLTEAEVIEMIR